MKQVGRSAMTLHVTKFRLGVRFLLSLETRGTSMHLFIHSVI